MPTLPPLCGRVHSGRLGPPCRPGSAAASKAIASGPLPFPARLAVAILALEYRVRLGLRQRTGHRDLVPDDLAQTVLDGALNVITPEGRKRAGFDDPVDVPDDAGPMERLVAFTGRPAG